MIKFSEIVSGNIVRFVEGDVLEVNYTAPVGHRVNNASIFNSRKATASMVLTKDRDGSVVDKFSYGIIAIKEVK